jgi:hypothetical protein
MPFIHPSAWNMNSANFATYGFCELRMYGVLRSSQRKVLKILQLSDTHTPLTGGYAALVTWERDPRVKAQERATCPPSRPEE